MKIGIFPAPLRFLGRSERTNRDLMDLKPGDKAILTTVKFPHSPVAERINVPIEVLAIGPHEGKPLNGIQVERTPRHDEKSQVWWNGDGVDRIEFQRIQGDGTLSTPEAMLYGSYTLPPEGNRKTLLQIDLNQKTASGSPWRGALSGDADPVIETRQIASLVKYKAEQFGPKRPPRKRDITDSILGNIFQPQD